MTGSEKALIAKLFLEKVSGQERLSRFELLGLLDRATVEDSVGDPSHYLLEIALPGKPEDGDAFFVKYLSAGGRPGARGYDEDGIPITYLLGISNGLCIELEVFKGDLSEIKRHPGTDELEII